MRGAYAYEYFYFSLSPSWVAMYDMAFLGLPYISSVKEPPITTGNSPSWTPQSRGAAALFATWFNVASYASGCVLRERCCPVK